MCVMCLITVFCVVFVGNIPYFFLIRRKIALTFYYGYCIKGLFVNIIGTVSAQTVLTYFFNNKPLTGLITHWVSSANIL